MRVNLRSDLCEGSDLDSDETFFLLGVSRDGLGVFGSRFWAGDYPSLLGECLLKGFSFSRLGKVVRDGGRALAYYVRF